MSTQNLTLLTDLYELTMMQGYFKNKNQNETVIFDAFYRSNPCGGGYAIAAGLEQVIDYIKNLKFTDEDIEFLRNKKLFSEAFLEYLKLQYRRNEYSRKIQRIRMDKRLYPRACRFIYSSWNSVSYLLPCIQTV